MNAAALGRHLDQWFAWTWHTSVYASVLILLVWLVQGLLGRRLSAGWRFAFGILVVVRLLVPDVPATRFSLFNFTGHWSDAKVRQPIVQDLPVPSEVSQPPLPAVNIPRVSAAARRPLDVMLVVRAMWLAGCAGSLLLVLSQHLRFTAWARRQKVVADPPTIALLQSCRKLLDVRREVRMIVSPRLGTPAVFGFFRPILLLPSGMLERMSAPELRLVFLHELVHVRRGDVLLNWAVIVARALHWFNPLAWFALNRFRADQELACDARVLAHLAVDERRLYGNTLLNLLTRHTRVPNLPGLVPLIHKKSDLERRITMITSFQPARRSATLASAAVFLVIGTLTLTRAANQNPAPPPEFLTAGEKPPPVASYDYIDAFRSPGPLAEGEKPAPAAQAHNPEERPDIDKDIPLTEAIRRANEQFPDTQPLTEDEVVTAVRAIKLTHPDIKEEVYETYMRVARERVLPKEMYFSQIKAWTTQYGAFTVDWKDLTLRGRFATAEETKEFMSKISSNMSSNATVTFSGPLRVGGFNYRIRARFISTQTPRNSGSKSAKVTLEVHQDGSLRLNQPSGETKNITLDQLQGILIEQLKNDPEIMLMIVADKSATNGQVTEVLNAAKAANLEKIGFRPK